MTEPILGPGDPADKVNSVIPTQHFRTVADMAAVPLDKIDAFCEDLRLWLTMRALCASVPATVATLVDPDVFGWIDDGKHDTNLRIVTHDGTVLYDGDFATACAAMGGDDQSSDKAVTRG